MPLGEWQSGERAPVMTIDALALHRCDFVKIGVEGMGPDLPLMRAALVP